MDGSLDSQPATLQCLDIRGGNTRTEEVVSSSDIDVWISSSPYGTGDEGGDIHYLSSCDQGVLTRISLADVSGHGVGASQLARHLHKLMRENINALDHSEFVKSLNDEFGKVSKGGHFATALVSAYYAPSCQLVICNAGHPKPLKYCGATNEWMFLDGEVGTSATGIENIPFGVIEGTTYSQFTVDIGDRDVVVFYSDALIEAKDATGQQIGEAGLLDLVKSIPIHDSNSFNARVLDGLNAYRADELAEDDETILSIRRRPAPTQEN